MIFVIEITEFLRVGGDEGSMCAGKMCEDAVLLYQDMGVSKNSVFPPNHPF